MRPSPLDPWLVGCSRASLLAGVLVGCAVRRRRDATRADRRTPVRLGDRRPRPGDHSRRLQHDHDDDRPVPSPRRAPAFATGNAQLDALLPTLPAVLFEGGADRALRLQPARHLLPRGRLQPRRRTTSGSARARSRSPARLTYVAVHELASQRPPQDRPRPPRSPPRSRVHRSVRAGAVGRLREGRGLRRVGAAPGRDGRERHHLLGVPRTLAQPGRRRTPGVARAVRS